MRLTIDPTRVDDGIAAARAFVAEMNEFIEECRRREVDPSDVIELIEAGADAVTAIAQAVAIRELNVVRGLRLPLFRRVLRARAAASAPATNTPTPKRRQAAETNE